MKKMMFFLILILFIILNFSGCIGTWNNPIQIFTAEDLIKMSKTYHHKQTYYIQENDIDLSEYDNWIPLSLEEYVYYNGNGFKIKNLTINDDFGDYQGLFSVICNYSYVYNLHLENVSIKGGHFVGGIAGLNEGSISNCYVSGKIEGKKNVGGIAGFNKSLIKSSDVNIIISAIENVGGITGVNLSKKQNRDYNFSNLSSSGEINAEINIGGIVGLNIGDVSNSTSKMKVNGESNIGGLVGVNESEVINSYSVTNVVGNESTGGLIGVNKGKVINSYSGADVAGDESTGGLVGVNESEVINSYSVASVEGNKLTGGLIGINKGKVINSYSIAKVEGNESTGGLIGVNEDGIIENSYYDLITSLQNDIGKGEGKTTEQMMKKETFIEWDFDFIWGIQENKSYPYFKDTVQKFSLEIKIEHEYGGEIFYLNRLYEAGEIVEIRAYPEENFKYWIDEKGKIVSVENPINFIMPEKNFILTAKFEYNFSGGKGTIEEPYLISNAKDLENINYNYDKHFKQVTDIDLSENENWNPIGILTKIEKLDIKFFIKGFEGTYDGNNYKISNIKINDNSLKGLFARLEENAEVKNLTLENIEYLGLVGAGGGLVVNNYGKISNVKILNSFIEGFNTIGGIVGYNEGTIINSCFEGNIKGNRLVGGLVGNNKGRLINISASGNILGVIRVGGLVGQNINNAYIFNAYSSGIVTGNDFVGGLIGDNEGEVHNSYSSSLVTGESNTGGLIGVNNKNGGIISSYYDNEVSGQNDTGKGEGKTTEQMMKKETYDDWDFKNIWEIIENETYPFFKYEK